MKGEKILRALALAGAMGAAASTDLEAQQGGNMPRLNQKRDGAIDAYKQAITQKKVTMLLDVPSADILKNPQGFGLVQIPIETERYRSFPLKSVDDVRLHVRPETKTVLDTLTQNALKNVKLPAGVQAVRPVVSSLTRNERLSSTEISAHTLALGIDFSIARIDVKSGGAWKHSANMPALLASVIDALKVEILKLQTEKLIVPTIEGNPPHLHISVMPTGIVPIPSKQIPKTLVPKAGQVVPPIAPKGVEPAQKTPAVVPPVRREAPTLPVQPEAVGTREGMAQGLKKYLLSLRPTINPDTHVVQSNGYLVTIDKKNYVGALVLTYRQLNDPKNALPKGDLAEIQKRIDFCKRNIR